MNIENASIVRLILAAVIVLTFAPQAPVRGQDKKQTAEQAGDVIRINTELVQMDVTVVDKQGRFVDGLRPEQFELRVGGKQKAIAFFERVTAGGPEEEKQLAAGRGRPRAPRGGTSAGARNRARTIFFFVDDVHLAPENLARTRQALLRFLDEGMGEGDQVAVVAASGQVGFLQQLTDNKAVLREAVGRLVYRRNPEVNATNGVPISEFDANQIEAGNRDLFRYLVQAMRRLGATNPVGTVVNRTRQINATARFDTVSTLHALDALVRSSAPLPGRKIVFFISDGFVTDPRRSGLLDSLRRVTATAAQVGAVIHTVDARGTFSDVRTDATQNMYPELNGGLSRNIFAEASITQEPLRVLAEDTGGQAIINSNSFDDSFRRALDDSSDYYLLAWRPDREESLGEKARVRVGIKDRPDLKVRVRRGFIEPPAILSTRREGAGGKAGAAELPEIELLAALGSFYPVRTLPVALSVGYVSTPDKGLVLTASMQIDPAVLKDGDSVETEGAEIDVLGVAMNDRGAISSFKQKLSVPADALAKQQEPIFWGQQLPLSPGLYQVRLAVRERRTGLTGSAMQWIEIPRVSRENFLMSSIFIAERKAGDMSAAQKAPVSVSRVLSRESRLLYQTYLYNAARGSGAPDVSVRVRVLQNGRPVMSTPEARPTASAAATDPARLSLSGEVALESLPAGRYVLEISASDQISRKSVSQQTDFIVE